MDLAALRVTRNGRDIHLGPTEFRLLRLLMYYPNRIFSREEIVDRLWGADAADEHEVRLADRKVITPQLEGVKG